MTQHDTINQEYQATYWRHGEGSGISGSLDVCLQFWDVHPQWLPDLAKLINKHGAIDIGDDNLGLTVSKADATASTPPFKIYWRLDGQPRKYRDQSPSKPPVNHCSHCGSANLRVLKGRAQHAAELRCLNCDRFVKWLPKTDPRARQFVQQDSNIDFLKRCLDV